MSMDNWPEKIKSAVVYVKYLHSNKEYQMADPHNNMDASYGHNAVKYIWYDSIYVRSRTSKTNLGWHMSE